VVGIDEVLDKAETAFQHRGAVAERALDGLPQCDLRMCQRDDADAEQALAGRESVGLPDNQAKVKNQPDHPSQLGHAVEVQPHMHMARVIEVLPQLQNVLEEVFQDQNCREIGHRNEEDIDGVSRKAAAKRCQRRTRESLCACRLMGIEEAIFSGLFHGRIIEPSQANPGRASAWRAREPAAPH